MEDDTPHCPSAPCPVRSANPMSTLGLSVGRTAPTDPSSPQYAPKKREMAACCLGQRSLSRARRSRPGVLRRSSFAAGCSGIPWPGGRSLPASCSFNHISKSFGVRLVMAIWRILADPFVNATLYEPKPTKPSFELHFFSETFYPNHTTSPWPLCAMANGSVHTRGRRSRERTPCLVPPAWSFG